MKPFLYFTLFRRKRQYHHESSDTRYRFFFSRLNLLLFYLFGCIKKIDWIELHFRRLKSASTILSRLKQRLVWYFVHLKKIYISYCIFIYAYKDQLILNHLFWNLIEYNCLKISETTFFFFFLNNNRLF